MVATERELERMRAQVRKHLRNLTRKFKREAGRKPAVYNRIYQYVVGYGFRTISIVRDEDIGEYLIEDGQGGEYICESPEEMGVPEEEYSEGRDEWEGPYED